MDLEVGALIDHFDSFFLADDNRNAAKVYTCPIDVLDVTSSDSPASSIALHCYPPSRSLQRSFWTICTVGVSQTCMSVPADIDNRQDYARCELMLYLPSDWEFPVALGGSTSSSDAGTCQWSAQNWPLEVLRGLGVYVQRTHAWLSYDHGIPNLWHPGQPFCDSTKLSALILLEPVSETPELGRVVVVPSSTSSSSTSPLPPSDDNVVVNVWLVVPLTAAEAEWKRSVGAENSIYHVVGDKITYPDIPIGYVMDPSRPCAVQDLGWDEQVLLLMEQQQQEMDSDEEDEEEDDNDDDEEEEEGNNNDNDNDQ